MPAKDVVVVEHHGGLGGRSRRTASEAPGALFQVAAVNGVPFRGKVGVLGEPLGALVTRPVHVKPKFSPFTAFAGYRAKATSAVAGVKDASKAKTKKNPVERLVQDTLDRAALASERLARLLLGPRTSPERIAVDAALKRVYKICFGDGSVSAMPRLPPFSATNSTIDKIKRFLDELRAAGVIDADGRVNQAEALGVAICKIVEVSEQHSASMMAYHQRAGAKDVILHLLFFTAQILLMSYSNVFELLEDITGPKTLSVKVQELLDWVKDHLCIGEATLDHMRDITFLYNFFLLDDHFA